MTPLLARYPRQLSGGQRQRVAMGRAIVRDPKVFLFDEPLSNLDAKLRVQMRAEIKELHQRLKTTTIYVTHDQVEAMTMADRIVVMRDGVVEQVGAPLDLYDRPANTVRRRLHRLAGDEPAEGLDPRQRQAVVPDRRRRGAAADIGAGRVRRAAVRLRNSPRASDARRRRLQAEVSVIEPTGSETQVFAKLGGQQIVGVFRERISARPGDDTAVLAEPRRGPSVRRGKRRADGVAGPSRPDRT